MDIDTNIDTITLEVSNTITTNHDYENLINKPTLNSVELIGNKTSSDLGLQGVLTAGTNISISNNTISAQDTTYSAGNNVSISNGVISATDTRYTAGNNISISNNTISAQDTTYSAGNNVSISNGVISATDTRYSAGNGISISNENVISATSSGTTNYNDLSYKPSINNVTLSGNKTTSDLGIYIPTKTSDLTNDSGFLTQHQDISYKADTSWVNTQLATKQNIENWELINSGSVSTTDVLQYFIIDKDSNNNVFALKKFKFIMYDMISLTGNDIATWINLNYPSYVTSNIGVKFRGVAEQRQSFFLNGEFNGYYWDISGGEYARYTSGATIGIATLLTTQTFDYIKLLMNIGNISFNYKLIGVKA